MIIQARQEDNIKCEVCCLPVTSGPCIRWVFRSRLEVFMHPECSASLYKQLRSQYNHFRQTITPLEVREEQEQRKIQFLSP